MVRKLSERGDEVKDFSGGEHFFTNWVAKMEVWGIPIKSLHKEMENS